MAYLPSAGSSAGCKWIRKYILVSLPPDCRTTPPKLPGQAGNLRIHRVFRGPPAGRPSAPVPERSYRIPNPVRFVNPFWSIYTIFTLKLWQNAEFCVFFTVCTAYPHPFHTDMTAYTAFQHSCPPLQTAGIPPRAAKNTSAQKQMTSARRAEVIPMRKHAQLR